MTILLFLIANENSEFDTHCDDIDLITHRICINKNLKTLNMYFDSFLDYDYVIIIKEEYIFNKKFTLKPYINILDNNNYHQVFFTSHQCDDFTIKDNIIEPKFNYFNFSTQKHLESSLSILENSLELNPRKFSHPSGRNITGLDYLKYATNNEINRPYFNLKPCIIKTDIFKMLKDIPLNYLYFDRKFSNAYSKHFKSCYLTDSVCIKNNKEIEAADENDMTIVTGFINIPTKDNKIKTHCLKKHKYSYLEKSIATLKIKQKMIVYIPENLYEHVYKIRKSINYLDQTKIIVITTDEFLYMKQHIDTITNNCKKNIETYKNPYYICAVSTRYNFIRDAIKNNMFGTNYFTWVDFGAVHCADMTEQTTFKYNKNKFRISWIARYKKDIKLFHYNHYVLGGTIFGGHKDIFKHVCDLHDEVFKENMELGYNCNDDKTLWFIFERYPELFDFYFTGYKNQAHKYNP